MSHPQTELDKIGFELTQLAKAYAEKAEALALDPYFREAVVKVSVSGFAWALYQAFDDEHSRSALALEMQVQTEALMRATRQEAIE